MNSLFIYDKRRTFSRALLVAILTPLPCLVAVTIADAIPLKPIELGLAHSQGFWIRCFYATGVITVSTIEQLRNFIPTAPVSAFSSIIVAFLVTGVTTIGVYALTLAIGYPLPFALAMLSVPWAISLFIALGFCLRPYMKQHPWVIDKVVQFILVVGCQVLLVVVYPAYTFVFIQLKPVQQTAFAFLLPLIKRFQKNLMSLALREVDDLKPEIIIFNVEVYNALFISFCMQGAKSIGTNLVLVSIDFILACASIRGLNAMLINARQLAERLGLDQDNLLLSAETIAQEIAESKSSFVTRAKTSQQRMAARSFSTSSLQKNQVMPFPSSPTRSKTASSQKEVAVKQSMTRPQTTTNERRQFLQQILQILRVTEYVLLIEYTEVIIPVVYSTYVAILSCLPNRIYYPQHSNLDGPRLRATIANVMMNAVLELLSLVILSVMIKKKLRLSPLHQISFVLENQWGVVQAKLIQWLIVSLQSSLIHVGADYTFKFSWLRKPHGS